MLRGKRALIVGLAGKRAIAWELAEAMARERAELAFTYQNDRLKDRVTEMATSFGSDICPRPDVGSDAEFETCFRDLETLWDCLDIVIHSVGFAPADQLDGLFIDSVTREGFKIAHDISSFSFPALAHAASPMMEGRNGALLALTYLGAVKAIPNYNVMDLAKASLESSVRSLAADLGLKRIRVNGISAGPIVTLAAAGVSGFRGMLKHVETTAPIR